MGWEPIAEALDAGADVVMAELTYDDLAIAAYPTTAGCLRRPAARPADELVRSPRRELFPARRLNLVRHSGIARIPAHPDFEPIVLAKGDERELEVAAERVEAIV